MLVGLVDSVEVVRKNTSTNLMEGPSILYNPTAAQFNVLLPRHLERFCASVRNARYLHANPHHVAGLKRANVIKGFELNQRE